MRSSVDLPAPLGPSTVRNSPAAMLKSAPDQTIFPPVSDARAEASMIGGAALAPGSSGAPAGTVGTAEPVVARPLCPSWRPRPGPGQGAASSSANHRWKLAPGAGSSR